MNDANTRERNRQAQARWRANNPDGYQRTLADNAARDRAMRRLAQMPKNRADFLRLLNEERAKT
jgi:hypothetical protein